MAEAYRPNDAELLLEVQKVKELSGWSGMMPEEYFYWMKYVRDHAPQRLLIWGLGFDSILIDKLNWGGGLRPSSNSMQIGSKRQRTEY